MCFSEVFPPLSLSGVWFFLDRLECESMEHQESNKAFLYGKDMFIPRICEICDAKNQKKKIPGMQYVDPKMQNIWDQWISGRMNLVKLGRDLTRAPGPPKGSFLEGKSLISGKFRLVTYYNLLRQMLDLSCWLS